MIFFILYAIGVWSAVYLLRGKWLAPVLLGASMIPVALATVLLLWPSLHPESRRILFANIGGYGALLSAFSGAYGFVVALVGVVIIATPRRAPAGCCVHCRYDLAGILASVCPECGAPAR